MQTIENINNVVNSFVWGPYMLVLLVGTGIYLTIRLNIFQITRVVLWMKMTYGSLGSNKKSSHNVTPFQAVSVALASTIGIGSIAGVSTALVAGGPGALFWMVLSAFFGMITKFSEVTLSVYFRNKDEKGIHYGGPMYYMEKGLKLKWLAMLFSIFAGIATFGAGNMTQSNAIASLMQQTFKVPNIASGIIVAFIVGLVIIGGIKRITTVTEKLVPFMALLYFISGLIILIINSKNLPNAINLVLNSAFSMESIGGGISGYAIFIAMRYGVARGVFSNEAGIGTAPIVHATSDTNNPIEQGMWGIFEVFNVLIICIITGLVVLSSGIYGTTNVDGAALTSLAFKNSLGFTGEIILTISSVLFALSTMIGWAYYGEKCFGYLTNGNKIVISIYKLAFIVAIVLASVTNLKLVWAISDTFNGLMAIPNLIAILLLSPIVITMTKKYLKDPKSTEIE
ncbi:sodium:alanine symporter family protein [uncultured Brachyspira sp.]|uniref:alanine/glycine:cation symporter family protein n=1 Tax=uncultured Brachyspira sp. TaxID=221953 RepID=UPI0026056DEE|nr:sodium:alanine symporter family protein [uncultured Brachyspira sp.]